MTLILVIDENPARAQSLDKVLRAAGYERVEFAEPSVNLLTLVSDLNPDVILMDMDLPTRDVLEQVAGVSAKMPRPIVMFTMDGDTRMIQDAIRAGVSAYVVDGLDPARVRPLIDVAIARFQEYRALRDELDRTRATLEQRKLIERAKGVIMTQRGCGEPEAYHILRRLAMNQQTTMAEIARGLIAAGQIFNSNNR